MTERRPNLLLMIPDGLQAAFSEPGSGVRMPNLEGLAGRGVLCSRAYTTNPTCSPARASLMTGLQPHNHGVLQVEHASDEDQDTLRRDKPHWAQLLRRAGYRTGYFGKWHIEPKNDLKAFGWDVNGADEESAFRELGSGKEPLEALLARAVLTRFEEEPEGYNRVLHYGVTDTPTEERAFFRTTSHALEFIHEAQGGPNPWACCVSFAEPNVPLLAGGSAFERVDPEAFPLPCNFTDTLENRPAFYQRVREVYGNITEAEWKTLRAIYAALLSELDAQLGRLLEAVNLEETIVLFLSDHGRYVGSHGMDHHNAGVFEEIMRVPLVCAGPGIAKGATCEGLISLVDLFPTLLEWAGIEAPKGLDGQSRAALLGDPLKEKDCSATAFAENHGTRFRLSQRVLWEGRWKFIFNGFDRDELYDLEADPGEMRNLAGKPEYAEMEADLMAKVWKEIKQSNDRALLGTHYGPLRIGRVGPG